MSGSAIRCPSCGHALLMVDEPVLPLQPTDAIATARRAPSGPLLLWIAEAAELLSISRSSLYQLVASGEVRGVRLGRTVRIPQQELERLAGPAFAAR